MPERIPVLLDTDPGNDIDDALAIGYLLGQPRCELLGITTVTGDVVKRAAIADVVCRVSGRPEVPIFAGRSEVVAYGPGQAGVAQYEAIRELPHRLDFEANRAVDFLRETIRNRPGEIVLLTIAPLSNIGILFALDPELPKLLRGVVSMAGAFYGHKNWETNCIVDPSATAMVLRSVRPSHLWYGLDVTMQVQESAELVRKHYVGQPLQTILPQAEVWFRHSSHIVYHDPLAAACVFEPDICEYESGTVLADPLTGKTQFDAGTGSDRVAVKVDVPRFFDHFYSVFHR